MNALLHVLGKMLEIASHPTPDQWEAGRLVAYRPYRGYESDRDWVIFDEGRYHKSKSELAEDREMRIEGRIAIQGKPDKDIPVPLFDYVAIERMPDKVRYNRETDTYETID